MLSWHSPAGTLPVRTAATKSASASSRPWNRSGSRGAMRGTTAVTPSASARGAAPSPSHVALPRSPTARQIPVHEVRNPSPAQLPVNANRSSSLIRKTAWAAAGPLYQLHGGL
jgi:hypothetical protein